MGLLQIPLANREAARRGRDEAHNQLIITSNCAGGEPLGTEHCGHAPDDLRPGTGGNGRAAAQPDAPSP